MKTTRHKKRLGALPSNYMRHKTINHFYPSCSVAVVYWISIMLAFVIWGFIYFSLVRNAGKSDGAFPVNENATAFMVLIAGIFSYLSHEFVHYFVSKGFGANSKWGGRSDDTLSYYHKKWLPKITASIWSSFVYSKTQYLCVILSPLVLLSITYLVLIMKVPASTLIGYFVLAGVSNGIFSVPDIFLAILVVFSPASAYFQDKPDGLSVYIPSNQIQ